MTIAGLKAARERLAMSQTDPAAAVGVLQFAASQWERGERVPSTENLAKVAKVLGVSVSWLLGGAVAESPEVKVMKAETSCSKAILSGYESHPRATRAGLAA